MTSRLIGSGIFACPSTSVKAKLGCCRYQNHLGFRVKDCSATQDPVLKYYGLPPTTNRGVVPLCKALAERADFYMCFCKYTWAHRQSIIRKSDLTDKMKSGFFQAAVVSILLYGCTTWTLTKQLEKKLDANYARMLRAILNKSWRQHPTRHQLYSHLPPITKTIQVRRTRHAGHCWRSMDELISDILLWTPTYGRAKAGRPARTYVQQLFEDTDVALKTCQRRWTIGRSGERGSGISVLAARHDDDDDDDMST